MISKREYTFDELRAKASHYCVAEEQCRQSVLKKLLDWGASRQQADDILDWLENERFIDEHRFVRSYCESKLLYQHWGRLKVEYMLREKGIDRDIIKEGLDSVKREDYLAMAHDVAENKLRTLRGEPEVVRQKLVSFLHQRGFEPELCLALVKLLLE